MGKKVGSLRALFTNGSECIRWYPSDNFHPSFLTDALPAHLMDGVDGVNASKTDTGNLTEVSDTHSFLEIKGMPRRTLELRLSFEIVSGKEHTRISIQ